MRTHNFLALTLCIALFTCKQQNQDEVEDEIITKQFHYVGIAVTNDGHRIYAITADSSIKIFHQTNLEQEWSIESNWTPSAICLSKSERLLYFL